METAGDPCLRLDRQHPDERAHLQPHIAGAPREMLGFPERVIASFGVAREENRKPSETGCRAP